MGIHLLKIQTSPPDAFTRFQEHSVTVPAGASTLPLLLLLPYPLVNQQKSGLHRLAPHLVPYPLAAP